MKRIPLLLFTFIILSVTAIFFYQRTRTVPSKTMQSHIDRILKELPKGSRAYISRGSIKYIVITSPAASSPHFLLMDQSGEYIAGDEIKTNAISEVAACKASECTVVFNRWLDDITFIVNVVKSDKSAYEVSVDALSGSIIKAD